MNSRHELGVLARSFVINDLMDWFVDYVRRALLERVGWWVLVPVKFVSHFSLVLLSFLMPLYIFCGRVVFKQPWP